MRIFSPSGVLWKHADFLRLWAAQTISSFGARIAREGLPLAAVLSTRASIMQIGILVALATAPSVIVGLFAGGFVDRRDKRGIMIASDLVRAAVLATVPVAALFHLLSMTQLYATAFVAGGAGVLFDIADHAYLPSLIGKSVLIEGNTKLSVTESLAEIGGPALAGILVQLLTAPFAIAVNAVTYLASAAFLFAIRKREEVREAAAGGRGWWSGIREGIATVMANEFVRPLFLMAVAGAFFGAFFSTLYVVYAIRVLGLTPALLGITIAVGGVASLIGTGLASTAVRRLGTGRAILWTNLIAALSAAFIPLAAGPLALRVACLMAAQFGGDAFGTAAIIPAVSARQGLLPRPVLGRAAAAFQAAPGAVRVLGALAGGFLATALGSRSTLWFVVLGNVAVVLWGFTTPLAALREPAAGAEMPPGP